jgi:hypothetical protein
MASKVTITNLAAYEAGLADGRAEQRAADIAALRAEAAKRATDLDSACWFLTAAECLESLGVGPSEEAGG